MAGPGSRIEKVGTIFSRLQGLLRSGALKESDKPVWYDVYASFPPRAHPIEKDANYKPPKELLYKEDLIRAKYYKTYGNVDVIDMRADDVPSVSQRFIDAYFEVKAAETVEKGKIFEAASEVLKREGVRLKTLEEREKERQELVAKRIAEASAAHENVIKDETPFGKTTPPEEAADTLDEDILNPDYDKLEKEK